MRPLVLAALAVPLCAAAAFVALRPAKAQGAQILYISGMRIAGAKPVAIVRLTNHSPDANDAFTVHYTIRDTADGYALSTPGAGLGATLYQGETLQLDLGKIVAQYRASLGAGPYKGTVQFVAFGEPGVTHEFASDVVHVEATQIEGAAVYEGVAQWSNQ